MLLQCNNIIHIFIEDSAKNTISSQQRMKVSQNYPFVFYKLCQVNLMVRLKKIKCWENDTVLCCSSKIAGFNFEIAFHFIIKNSEFYKEEWKKNCSY